MRSNSLSELGRFNRSVSALPAGVRKNRIRDLYNRKRNELMSGLNRTLERWSNQPPTRSPVAVTARAVERGLDRAQSENVRIGRYSAEFSITAEELREAREAAMRVPETDPNDPARLNAEAKAKAQIDAKPSDDPHGEAIDKRFSLLELD